MGDVKLFVVALNITSSPKFQSVVAGQAPINLERKNNLGGKKMVIIRIHITTQANRTPQARKHKATVVVVCGRSLTRC